MKRLRESLAGNAAVLRQRLEIILAGNVREGVDAEALAELILDTVGGTRAQVAEVARNESVAFSDAQRQEIKEALASKLRHSRPKPGKPKEFFPALIIQEPALDLVVELLVAKSEKWLNERLANSNDKADLRFYQQRSFEADKRVVKSTALLAYFCQRWLEKKASVSLDEVSAATGYRLQRAGDLSAVKDLLALGGLNLVCVGNAYWVEAQT